MSVNLCRLGEFREPLWQDKRLIESQQQEHLRTYEQLHREPLAAHNGNIASDLGGDNYINLSPVD